MRFILSIIISGVFLAACQPKTGVFDLVTTPEPALPLSPLDRTIAEPYEGQSNAASFLLGYRANLDKDMGRAAEAFNDALSTSADNQKLMALAFRSYFINGNITAAAALASASQQLGVDFDYGSEPALVLALQAQDWAGALAVSDLLLENTASQPIGIILGAWALVFQDQGDAGLTRLLDLVQDENAPPPTALFTQSALISEYLGRPKDALASATMALDQDHLGLTSAITMAGLLARHGESEEAKVILTNRLGSYFNRDAVLSAVDDGTSFLLNRPDITTVLAEAYIDAANVPTPIRTSRLARAHAAGFLAPDVGKVNYMLGLYYQDLEQLDTTEAYHDRIKPASIWYHPAQFLKARRLGADPKTYEESIAIFEHLVQSNPNNVELLIQKGHTARRHDHYDVALLSYQKALAIEPDHPTTSYYLGITFDRLDRKQDAEAALRRSLTYNSGDAYALNYLGYWLLEENGDPEEALGFIRKAIEIQPQNGFFMDSLGWGYFKLGRLKQALIFMERAVMLRPVDPLITDHLGDVYAALGRHREAAFQWQRALDLVAEGQSSEDLDLDQVTAKINAFKEGRY